MTQCCFRNGLSLRFLVCVTFYNSCKIIRISIHMYSLYIYTHVSTLTISLTFSSLTGPVTRFRKHNFKLLTLHKQRTGDFKENFPPVCNGLSGIFKEEAFCPLILCYQPLTDQTESEGGVVWMEMTEKTKFDERLLETFKMSALISSFQNACRISAIASG